MHRVRMLENNWTQGNAIGFAVSREQRQGLRRRTAAAIPAITTHTLIQLDSKVGVIVLTNADDSNPDDIAMQLMNTVGEAVAKAATAPRAKTVTWDPSWSRFAGLYRGRGGDSHVVELNQRLVIITPNAPIWTTPSGSSRSATGSSGLWRAAGGGPVGEVVRFVEEGGRVVRMITGDSYVDRVR